MPVYEVTVRKNKLALLINWSQIPKPYLVSGRKQQRIWPQNPDVNNFFRTVRITFRTVRITFRTVRITFHTVRITFGTDRITFGTNRKGRMGTFRTSFFSIFFVRVCDTDCAEACLTLAL